MEAVLIIVDMQQGAADEDHGVIALGDQIAAFARKFDRVIATRFINDERSLFWNALDYHAMPPDSDAVSLLPAIRRVAHQVIDKPGRYGLTEDQLRELALPAQVVVCGVDTDQCVLAIVLDLWDEQILSWVVEDLCWATSGHTPHEAGIIALRRAVGDDHVVAAKQVLEHLYGQGR